MKRQVLTGMVCMLLSTSCGGMEHRELNPARLDARSQSVTVRSQAASSHNQVHFADPGPFKLWQRDGEEFWLGRGELGSFGGTLRVGSFGSGPKTFNPWVASDVQSGGLGMLLFERLVDIDAWTGKPYPRLAKSIEISPGRCDYKIRLRRGLRWSDAEPITADDVVFTFNTIVAKGYGNSSLRDTLSVYGKFPTVTKIDRLTVNFHTAVPFAPFLTELANVPIAPRHKLMEMCGKKPAAFNGFWDVNADPRDIVVSGRFRLDRYVPGQRIELSRNPNYGMVDRLGRRLPYLEHLMVSIVPDENTQILKFRASEIDFLDVRSVRGLDAALMKREEKQGNFRMYNLGPDDGTMFLMLNLCRRKKPETGKFYVDPVKQRWFNDRGFRQALNHGIDRECMVANILRGVGLPLYTAESTASLYFDNDLAPFGQDLKLAAQLLSKSGFFTRAGRLYDRQGHPVEFSLYTNAGNTARDACCVMIVNDLKKLGIKVNYQPIDFNILIDKTNNSLDWEAVVMGLTGSKIEPYDGANVWKSDGRLHMFDQRLPDENGKIRVSDARAWETRLDQVFDQGATTFGEAARHKLFDEYQRIVYDQAPFIYLYSILDITAMRNTVGNYRPTPLGIFYTPLGSLHNLEEIYFRQPGQP